MIDVMFRREVFNGISRLLVYFPYEFSDNHGNGTCLTMQDSHSGCTHEYIMNNTKPLKRGESNIACHYILKHFGYNAKEVNVIQRSHFVKRNTKFKEQLYSFLKGN